MAVAIWKSLLAKLEDILPKEQFVIPKKNNNFNKQSLSRIIIRSKIPKLERILAYTERR